MKKIKDFFKKIFGKRKKEDYSPLKINVVNHSIKTYEVRMVISEEDVNPYYNSSEYMDLVRQRVESDLLKQIANDIEFRAEYNPLFMGYQVRARIRVVDPRGEKV